MKARLIAGDADGAAEDARWALDAGAGEAGSPIGRYAATLALLVLGRDHEARVVADDLRDPRGLPDRRRRRARLPGRGHDAVGYTEAIESVLESFEARGEYLEDVPVADTVLALQALARPRGLEVELASAPTAVVRCRRARRDAIVRRPRTRLAGVSSLGSASNARATASALSAPVTR